MEIHLTSEKRTLRSVVELGPDQSSCGTPKRSHLCLGPSSSLVGRDQEHQKGVTLTVPQVSYHTVPRQKQEGRRPLLWERQQSKYSFTREFVELSDELVENNLSTLSELRRTKEAGKVMIQRIAPTISLSVIPSRIALYCKGRYKIWTITRLYPYSLNRLRLAMSICNANSSTSIAASYYAIWNTIGWGRRNTL